MGLKTTNYTTKKTGIFMPTAYAKLRTFVLEKDNSFRATFSIQENRDKLDVFEPVEIVSVSGKITDRSVPLQRIAYEVAKQYKKFVFNEEAQKNEIEYGELYEWQDDYV